MVVCFITIKKHTLHPIYTMNIVTVAYQPLDPSLREEKETISFTLDELRGKLVQRRREGFSTARQQQRQKGEYCLEAFVSQTLLWVTINEIHNHFNEIHRADVPAP